MVYPLLQIVQNVTCRHSARKLEFLCSFFIRCIPGLAHGFGRTRTCLRGPPSRIMKSSKFGLDLQVAL